MSAIALLRAFYERRSEDAFRELVRKLTSRLHAQNLLRQVAA